MKNNSWRPETHNDYPTPTRNFAYPRHGIKILPLQCHLRYPQLATGFQHLYAFYQNNNATVRLFVQFLHPDTRKKASSSQL